MLYVRWLQLSSTTQRMLHVQTVTLADSTILVRKPCPKSYIWCCQTPDVALLDLSCVASGSAAFMLTVARPDRNSKVAACTFGCQRSTCRTSRR